MGKVYRLIRTQNLPMPLEEAWQFFSDPRNLKVITPPHLGFKILSELDGKMKEGQLIRYKVKPLLGIPLTWVTRICEVEEGKHFADEQLKGPYQLWYHRHYFEVIPGGVAMKDVIDYSLPLGWLGQLAHWLFVKRQVESIFEFRKKVLDEKFGEFPKT